MFPKQLGLFFRLTRPLFLIGVALLYALGVGIAHYLGHPIDWGIYLLGQLWVSLCQLIAQYLNEFFDFEGDQDNSNRTHLTGGSGALGPGKLPRQTALIAAYACLAFLASITVLLVSKGKLNPPVILIMFLALLGSIFYSTPPLKLEGSGYGELLASVVVAFLTPAFAFILQSGEWHRLVAMSTFPLVALHLAMLLGLELPDYGSDMKHEKGTLMVRLGWQNGIVLHNILILSAFLLFSIARLFSYPWFASLSGILALPVGIFQIWQMRQISQGSKPNWNLLTIGAVSLFVLPVYFLAFSFWIN